MGHCEAPADHPAAKDCHGLEGVEMCRRGRPALDRDWVCDVVSLGPAMGVAERRGSMPGESGSLLL